MTYTPRGTGCRPVNVSLPVALVDELDRPAAGAGISRSAAITQAAAFALETMKGRPSWLLGE